MAHYRRQSNQDRYLVLRNGIYHYKRRVPAVVSALDPRSPHVRTSLKTSDLAMARAKRDILERADDELWSAKIGGTETDIANARYRAAVTRVEALGFSYKPASEIAYAPLGEIVRRVESVDRAGVPREINRAVLGFEDRPAVKISEAFKKYADEIVHDKNMGKSPGQRKRWRTVKARAVTLFVKLVSDKPIDEISRDDAMVVYNYWRERIAPIQGAPTHSPSSGNRDLNNLKILHSEYFKHLGADLPNPFANLGFMEKKSKKKKRPPFSTAWITNLLKKPNDIAGMNSEYRGLMLAIVETGCRPSELCNILPEHIHADAEVPYIEISPWLDPKSPREIKTDTSARRIPLVGVSLAVFRKHPKGFPSCIDRENNVTTAINKFMQENKLYETPKHSLYGFRHSFEDRMKEGGIDHELRKILMGHAIDRPDYGTGGSLAWRRKELMKIVLPFDPAIV